MILKTSKKMYGVMFFDTLKHAYSENVFDTLCIEIKPRMLKKFPSDKINGTKIISSFFFRELQLITALLLICDSYMS